ncbi:hypothetical protein FRB90_006756, partial [Tulasnella sp. 427]
MTLGDVSTRSEGPLRRAVAVLEVSLSAASMASSLPRMSIPAAKKPAEPLASIRSKTPHSPPPSEQSQLDRGIQAMSFSSSTLQY